MPQKHKARYKYIYVSAEYVLIYVYKKFSNKSEIFK